METTVGWAVVERAYEIARASLKNILRGLDSDGLMRASLGTGNAT